MSSFVRDTSYREVASALTPAAVSQYLATEHWELEAKQERIREIWRLPGSSRELRGRIMLPLATDYEDFPQRFVDALRAIGKINGWDADQVLERIISARADLFFVRLHQTISDGTIPFRQAEASIDAIYKMLKAAATTAADPAHSHRGRRPAVVNDYLEEDVRLGHTKRGSFVFTIVSRLKDAAIVPIVRRRSSHSDSYKIFGRHVMETLALGLETTRDLANGRRPDALTIPSQWGLSAGLVESLEDISCPGRLRALDLSFEWAGTESPPDVGREPILLEERALGELPRVRERLIRQEKPPRRETLVGVVRSLTREEGVGGDSESGSVTMVADIDGRLRNVHLSLEGRDHEWAILAYREKVPITVTGALLFQRRSWQLVGEIELDASFLRHRFGDDPAH